ncbi:MAG: hypothetical protein F9K29_19380 [Hyphomicrobiaceae bacterium]|nr:MAG: hypothetical protein F9K29_19380 [Hyphomicrobiaceae bacterium]
MQLGTIIASLADETMIQDTLADIGDLVLLARVKEASAAAGEPPGSFAAAAVGNFITRADDEAWLSLMTAASKADNPAAACLRYMLIFSIGPASAPSGATQPAA